MCNNRNYINVRIFTKRSQNAQFGFALALFGTPIRINISTRKVVAGHTSLKFNHFI